MSRLEELIQEYCPDGVKYKRLNEVCTYVDYRGKTPKKVDSGVFLITAKNIRRGYIDYEASKEYIAAEDYDDVMKRGTARLGDILITTEAPCGNAAIVDRENIALAQRVIKYRCNNDMNPNFLLHVILGTEFQKKLSRASTGGTVKGIKGSKLHLLEVPVPPLPVQQEIVRILDSFTELTAELQAELQARKKQYEYYRDELLTPKNEIPKVKLGEFAEICRGGNFQKKDFVSNGYPCIHYGQIYTHYGTYTDSALTNVDKAVYDRSKKAKSGDIIMAVTSENIEDVCKATAWLGNENIAVSGHTAIIHHQQNPKYLSYYFASNAFFNQKKKLAHGTKVIEVTPSSLANIEVPLPSLEVQNRLVNVLDNFDSICTDLNIGLPAEIEARQKQYEFYRDSLLTFAETGQMISQTDRQTELNAIKLIQYVFGYVPVELGTVATVTKLAGYEFTKYVTYSDKGKFVALRGLNVKNGKLDLGDVKYIDNSDLSKLNRSKLCNGDMLFTYVGTIGQVAVINENNKYYLAPNVALIRVNKELVNPEYMRYFFQTSVFRETQINRLLQSSSMKNIPMEKIRKFILQIPTIEEQNHIVGILDRFDTLCNDISSGLPAEIEARQKQYEYYRDKLLSFKEKQH